MLHVIHITMGPDPPSWSRRLQNSSGMLACLLFGKIMFYVVSHNISHRLGSDFLYGKVDLQQQCFCHCWIGICVTKAILSCSQYQIKWSGSWQKGREKERCVVVYRLQICTNGARVTGRSQVLADLRTVRHPRVKSFVRCSSYYRAWDQRQTHLSIYTSSMDIHLYLDYSGFSNHNATLVRTLVD